ncbi:hypothetical protein QFZ73_003157 [Peribacillus sp. V2I11]|nr:hypothetical protein [Peribacillus sp. V2I11]
MLKIIRVRVHILIDYFDLQLTGALAEDQSCLERSFFLWK